MDPVAIAVECLTFGTIYYSMNNPLPTESDEALLSDLRSGKEQALDSLFRTHYSFLCQVVFRMIGDANQAEDLVQEVFYELWRKREKLQINQSIRAYLKRSAVNRTLNFIRDRKLVVNDESALPLDLASSEAGATQQQQAEELQQQINVAIGELPERCRIVFSLSRFEHMSNQQIADQLDISTKTVENQMTKALRYLRERLSPYIGVIVFAVFTWISTIVG